MDIDKLVQELTLEEKVSLVGGRDFWHTNAVERLGIPAIKVTDGPNGARGDGVFGTGTKTLCIPCGSALGATFDPDLVRRLGEALGVQARAKGAHVLLAPTVNIHRSPLAGRNFECYSEDPHLAARLAVAFISGVQSQKVGTTVKHFAGNESEYERHAISSRIGERALREIYLVPFEAAVAEAGTWGLMSAYNKLNGVWCSENPRLLDEILRDEWGFDGFVVSDWGGTHTTVDAANAGLDLEMPGRPRFFNDTLVEAVKSGAVAESTLDAKARRLLLLMERTDAFDDPRDGPEQEADLPEHRALIREAAAGAMVLLRNESVLPLDRSSLRSVAVLGPNADRAIVMGGGSANVRPYRWTTPLEAIAAKLDGVEVVHEPGCVIDRTAPPMTASRLRTPDGDAGIRLEYFASTDLSGEVVATEVSEHTRFMWTDNVPDGVDPRAFSVRATGSYRPKRTGPHVFGLVTVGRSRLSVDGELVCDGWADDLPRGTALLGMASEELTATVDLTEGQDVDIVVEHANDSAPRFSGLIAGVRLEETQDMLQEAADAARAADVAIVVVGTDHEWETEGRDRESMTMPGAQDALIRSAIAANPRTVVVLNAGSPVHMEWAERAGAIVWTWFGGEEMANALADVLVGDTDPSGRLPMTIPVRYEDNPAFTNYPGEAGEVSYGEGVFVGYRYYDAKKKGPRFAFGHGLSYARFVYGAPEAPEEVTVDDDMRVEVTVPVTNTSERAGTEVVQCYVRDLEPRLARPPQELRAFAKVRLDPGETRDVRLELDFRSFAYYDPELPGWRVDPGDYELWIGRSSRDARRVVPLKLTADG